jgi:hypothetical protein
MGATGVIEDMRHANDQTRHSLNCSMQTMIEKASRLNSPLPTYFTTDNVRKDMGCLKKALEKACPILRDRYDHYQLMNYLGKLFSIAKKPHQKHSN